MGPHRKLLEFLDQVHVDNGVRSLRDIASAMNLASRARVSALLRGVDGTLPADEAQLERLVRALGGGHDEIARGRLLYRDVRKAKTTAPTVTAIRPGNRRATGWLRVVDSDPRGLGVHGAIAVPGSVADLPAYVLRDVDDDLRAIVRDGSAKGCFLLVVGKSSVGKSRSLFEALRAIVPDWVLVHPADTGELRQLSRSPLARSVVWLDELQKYLAGGLTAGDLRAIRRDSYPAIIVATLWPRRYQRYTTLPSPGAMEDPYQAERELLDLAELVTLVERLTPDEHERASVLARSDPRIQQALSSEYGMTQALAAAPALVSLWRQAQDVHKALLTAAIDARRMGIESPLSADLLRAAVPGYLTAAERAKAPRNWFEEAMAYATRELHGAVCALVPVGEEMGIVAGYTVADYLLQDGVSRRRDESPPQQAWDAYLAHISEVGDLLAAARAAERLRLPNHAEALLRKALHRGNDAEVRPRLALLLRRRGQVEDAVQVWRDGVAAGDPGARLRLTVTLQSLGRVDDAIEVWREAASAGDPDAHVRMSLMLKSAGRIPEAIAQLRKAVSAKPDGAREWLAAILQDEGRVEEALDVWRQGLANSEEGALDGLVVLLQAEGRLDEAESALRRALTAGASGIRSRLAELLHQKGDVDAAIDVWQQGIAAGEASAASGLAVLLQSEGRIDEAIAARRTAIAGGDQDAYSGLAELFEREDRADEAIQTWRKAMTAGIPNARAQLTGLLLREELLEEAITLSREGQSAGDPNATQWLTELTRDRT
jgi:tetratricopeptide (TPR) repeat protein